MSRDRQARNSLALLCALCMAVLLCGCGGDEQPANTGEAKNSNGSSDQATNQDGGADDNSNKADDFPPYKELDLTQDAFMAQDLVESYDNDSEKFLEALGGRTIQISGPLVDVGHEVDQETDAGELVRLGEPFVMFGSGLKCLTKAETPWSSSWRGDLAIVTGRMSEYELVMFDAEVTLVDESNIVSMAAVDLAAEFALDAELASDAYYGYPIQVTGEVQDVAFNSQGAAQIVLAGKGSVRVGCICTAFEYHRVKDLAPGDRFTGTGEFLEFLPGQGVIEIGHVVPVRIEK